MPLSRPAILRGRRLLVVDDNPVEQRLLDGQLRYLGAEPVSAWSGREALQRLRRDAFDIVLLDSAMPDGDGAETLERLRDPAAATAHSTVPVVVLTADRLFGDRERWRALGMTDYLLKPIDPRDLAATLVQVVQAQIATPDEALALFEAEELAFACAGNEDLLRTVAETFLGSSALLLIELEQAAWQGDPDRVRRLAHQLKGAAASARAPLLAAYTATLEGAGGPDTLAHVEELQRLADLTAAAIGERLTT